MEVDLIFRVFPNIFHSALPGRLQSAFPFLCCLNRQNGRWQRRRILSGPKQLKKVKIVKRWAALCTIPTKHFPVLRQTRRTNFVDFRSQHWSNMIFDYFQTKNIFSRHSGNLRNLPLWCKSDLHSKDWHHLSNFEFWLVDYSWLAPDQNRCFARGVIKSLRRLLESKNKQPKVRPIYGMLHRDMR